MCLKKRLYVILPCERVPKKHICFSVKGGSEFTHALCVRKAFVSCQGEPENLCQAWAFVVGCYT